MVDKSPLSASPAMGASDAHAALPQDFESALSQLEALVAQMESGALPLEESLKAYEKGVELAKICQRRLDMAEQHVQVLQDNLLKPLADTPNSDED